MSTGPLTLTFPWASLASSNKRNRRRGGRAHAQSYKDSLHAIYMRALNQTTPPRPRWPDQDVELHLMFFPPDRNRRDMSNYLKGLADALEGVVYADDWQIVAMSWQRMDPDPEQPRVRIVVREPRSGL